MKLSVPIDVYLLTVAADGNRTTPHRTVWELEELFGDAIREHHRREVWNREYVTSRMTDLADFEMLEKLPPENSGLYLITPFGRVALYGFVDEGRTEWRFADLAAGAEKIDPERGRPTNGPEWLTVPEGDE